MCCIGILNFIIDNNFHKSLFNLNIENPKTIETFILLKLTFLKSSYKFPCAFLLT